MKHFYGYGSWKSKYWFVGLEEGTGKAKINGDIDVTEPVKILEEKLKRFHELRSALTHVNPRERLLDIKKFQGDLYPKHFDTSFKGKEFTPQATHKQFIRILCYIELDIFPEKNEGIKHLQATDFGNITPTCLPQHCAIELLPFPSPSRADVRVIKKYKNAIPDFNSSTKLKDYKKEYERVCFSKKVIGRIDFLNKQLAKKPKLVVFYAPEYFHSILNITQSKYRDWHILNLFPSSIIEHYSMAYWFSGQTVFMIVNHPARCKIRKYWECVCQKSKQLLIDYKLLP